MLVKSRFGNFKAVFFDEISKALKKIRLKNCFKER